jgi:polyisoprenoid-binding protein YceI
LPRPRWAIPASIAAVIVVGLAAIWYFVFRDDSPEAVDLGRAAQSLDDTRRMGSDGAPAVEGTWSVDPAIGDFADFSSSFAGFRVQEELAGIGAKTAVGRTPDVTGSLTIEGTTISVTEIEVDMTTLETDNDRRDGAIRNQAIETSQFPTATFTLTEPIELRELPAEGKEVQVDAVGDLTLHGVTRQVTFPLEAQVDGDVITVTGSLEVQFADYDIEKPTAAIVLSVEDKGVIEVQLFFTKA